MNRNTRIGILAALLLAIAIPGCATMTRPPETAAELAERKRREDQACVDLMIESHQRMLQRMVVDADTKRTFDVLVLSGGGDFGAFGAGFLLGWAQCTDPALRRPEFDFVAGTSTGSILAPLAYVGTDEAIGVGAKFYSDPPKDLVKPRGLLPIWPWNVSLADPSGLRKTLETQLDAKLLDQLREGNRQARVLACAATNADFGTFRPFDLLAAADRPDEEFRQYLVDRIMASAAVPGVFPPVLIDGSLFVDGGVTENAWTLRDQSMPDSALSRWRALHPDKPLPRIRLWYLVNNQLFPPGEVVTPEWLDVAGRGLSTAIRSALIKDLMVGAYVARLTNNLVAGEVEFRFVAIPDDWTPPVPGNFKPETMRALVELGEKMGRDPASWQTEVPHLDGVGGWTPYTEPLRRPDGAIFKPGK